MPRSPKTLFARLPRLAAPALVAGAVGVAATPPAFAAALGVASSRLTAWQSATVVCSQPGTLTLSAAGDSYVQQNNATTTAGGSTTLSVQGNRSGSARRTLVAFSLPAIPSGCALTAAGLRLYASSAATGRTIEVHRAAAPWSESTVTWNTMPSVAGAAVTTTSATGWNEWNVRDLVSAQYSGSNNGFVIRDSVESGSQARAQTYASRENATSANRPQLLITFG